MGSAGAKLSTGLEELSRCAESNSERDTRRLMVGKFGLSLPIPLRAMMCSGGTKNIKCLHLRDWAKFLMRANSWHILCGLVSPNPQRERDIWSSFWERYKSIEPDHPIYGLARSGKINLADAAAMLLHGDEGRGRKRSAFFVLSFRSILGRGCNVPPHSSNKVSKAYLKQKLNLIGSTMTNRYLVGVLPKDVYSGQEEVLNSLLQVAADEAEFMATEGIMDSSGGRKFMVLLKIVGDWPFLARSGHLVRNYATVQKRLDLRKSPTGICHLCLAGRAETPFEQFTTRSPRWLQTMFVEAPFRQLPVFSRVLHAPNRLEALWAFDLFHAFHIGAGKCFAGSALALMSQYETGPNIDSRFQQLSQRYLEWCAEHKRTSYLKRITKDTIQWESTSEYPNGNWHKGGLTQVLMEFIEDLLCNHLEAYANDYQLVKAGEAAKSINEFFRILYGSDAWLEKEAAVLAGEYALRYLRRYAELAAYANRNNMTLWIIQPKLHILQHVALELVTKGVKEQWVQNPLLFSVQSDEDFVGRPSRTSRRVSSKTTITRVIQRHLQAAYRNYVNCGYLREPA